MNFRLLRIAVLLFLIFTIVEINAQTTDGEFELSIVSPESIAGTYEWGGTIEWGGSIVDDLCGELVWAEGSDTEGCAAFSTNLEDKIALIRRGTCDFSVKVFNAQEAGAKAVVIVNHNLPDNGNTPTTLVGMLGGENADSVSIPAVFITYNSGLAIVPEVESGTVEICFKVPRFNNAIGPYAYSTPQSQIVPLDNLQVRVFNRGLSDQVGVNTTLGITNPLGETEVLTTEHTVAAGEFEDVTFESYLPKEIGEYTMLYTSGIDGETIERKFEVTEFTWAMDNGNVTRAIGPSAEQFEEALFEYQHANLVLAGSDGIATHVTFGIGNGAELFVGEESADLVLMAIYDGDKDGDGQIDDFADFASLGDPIEVGFYQLDGTETFDNLITVPFDNPVALEEGGIYYVSLQYSGIDAGTGVGPQFSATNDVQYLTFPSTPLELNELFSGWAGAIVVTRLQLEGFVSAVEDFKPLAKDKLTIFSNPIKNGRLSFELQLEEASKHVNFMLRNLEGKLMKQLTYSNVSRVDENIDIKGIPAGTYILNVHTDEGFGSRKIVVID